MADDDTSLAASGQLTSTSVQLLPSPPTTDGVDITRHIKFKLDSALGNYHKWRNLFLFVLSKYNARHHVEEETDPHLADDQWRAADVDIVLWIYATISDQLQDVILQADGTAYTAWQALKHFFTENAEGREIHLDKEFTNASQGDMDVVSYCRKLKGIADQLGDVGAPVTDKKLTMRLIAGLDDRFKVQQEILETMKPFPSFAQAQSRLQLAEEKLKIKAAATPQILHTNANGSGTSGFRFNGNCWTCGEQGHPARNCPRGGDRGHHGYGQHGRGGGQHQHGRGGGGQQNYYGANNYNGQHNYGQNNYNGQYTYNGRGRGRGRGRGDQGGRGGYNPGYGHQQQQHGYGGARPTQWAPPNAASILGPTPGPHFQAYSATNHHSAPPMPGLYTPPPVQTFDYTAMFNSAPSNVHGFNHGSDWVMDSGATTHVTNSQGPSNADPSSSVQ